MKLLIKFPSRARREIFKNTFNLYYSKLSGKHEVEFRVTMDVDDSNMNMPEVIEFLDSKKNITYCYGNSNSKVSAINANMEDVEFDVLLLASDDMIPKEDGYDDVIISKMKELYPELDGALHFNDGRQSELCTLSIMGKNLYDRFGYIYHPDYKSLWCDNEFHDVCQQWNVMKFVDQVIIHHQWADVHGGDALHYRNEALYNRDKAVYEARKKAGFPTESIGDIPVEIFSTRRKRIDRRRVTNRSV